MKLLETCQKVTVREIDSQLVAELQKRVQGTSSARNFIRVVVSDF